MYSPHTCSRSNQTVAFRLSQRCYTLLHRLLQTEIAVRVGNVAAYELPFCLPSSLLYLISSSGGAEARSPLPASQQYVLHAPSEVVVSFEAWGRHSVGNSRIISIGSNRPFRKRTATAQPRVYRYELIGIYLVHILGCSLAG